MQSFSQYLTEKLILFNNGAKYGNVVFLAGGGGSGKGFASENFMGLDSYKRRDVDEFKNLYIKLNQEYKKKTGQYKHPEIGGVDLRNPNDVFKVHMFVKKQGSVDKTLKLLLGNATNPDHLPNILFDITGKDMKDYTDVLPALKAVGYKPENIHITWILTNYHIAVAQNKTRERIVPDDIMLQTHEGAAHTMFKVLNGDIPKGIDGDINVVLNNTDQTVIYPESPNAKIKGKKRKVVIEGFTYLKVKRAGEPMQTPQEIRQKLFNWMKDNVPRTSKLKQLFGLKDAPVDERANDNQQQMKRPDPRQTPEQNNSKVSKLVTIHRKMPNGRVGFAFKKRDGNIGFDMREAELKMQSLKKMFPSDQFVVVPYNPRNHHLSA